MMNFVVSLNWQIAYIYFLLLVLIDFHLNVILWKILSADFRKELLDYKCSYANMGEKNQLSYMELIITDVNNFIVMDWMLHKIGLIYNFGIDSSHSTWSHVKFEKYKSFFPCLLFMFLCHSLSLMLLP